MKENSIEEDIKILENMNDGYTFKDCDVCNNYNEKTKCCDKHKCMELQAIDHILSDYKRILKENEELHREINRRIKLKIENEKIVDTQFIYKPKVKDKIEELHKLLADIDYKDIEDKQEREFYKKQYYQVVAQIKVLKELLKFVQT